MILLLHEEITDFKVNYMLVQGQVLIHQLDM